MTRLIVVGLILASGTARADTTKAGGGSSPTDVWERAKAAPLDQEAQLLLIHPQTHRHMIAKMLRSSDRIIGMSSNSEAARTEFDALCKDHGINLKKKPKIKGILISKADWKKLTKLAKSVKDPIQCLLDMTDWAKRNSAGTLKTKIPAGELQNIEQGARRASGMGVYRVGRRSVGEILHFRKLRGRWYFYIPQR